MKNPEHNNTENNRNHPAYNGYLNHTPEYTIKQLRFSRTAPSYVLTDISTGDIIDIDGGHNYEITREYTEIP